MDFIEKEYDAWTGETKSWYFDGNDIVCERTADPSKLIDACKNEANVTGGFSGKQKFHKVASIPPIVQHEIMKRYHLDVFSTDPNDIKRLEKIIEIDYPVLKTNSSKLWRPV